MREFPLLFCFKNVVVGNGFIAGVVIKGRALLAQEEADVWMMYGVNPGGMAADGEDRNEAMKQFRVSYDSILNDIAADSRSFKAFQTEVERFFSQISDEAKWLAAVDEVRRTGEADNWEAVLNADSASLAVVVKKLTQRNAAPKMNRDPREEKLKLAA
jgi:hypothetical protein